MLCATLAGSVYGVQRLRHGTPGRWTGGEIATVVLTLLAAGLYWTGMSWSYAAIGLKFSLAVTVLPPLVALAAGGRAAARGLPPLRIWRRAVVGALVILVLVGLALLGFVLLLISALSGMDG